MREEWKRYSVFFSFCVPETIEVADVSLQRFELRALLCAEPGRLEPDSNFWCEFGLTAGPASYGRVRAIQRRQNNRADAKTASDAKFPLIVPTVLSPLL